MTTTSRMTSRRLVWRGCGVVKATPALLIVSSWWRSFCILSLSTLVFNRIAVSVIQLARRGLCKPCRAAERASDALCSCLSSPPSVLTNKTTHAHAKRPRSSRPMRIKRARVTRVDRSPLLSTSPLRLRPSPLLNALPALIPSIAIESL